MGLDSMIAALLAQQSQPQIAASNPYSGFVGATDSIGNAVLQGAGSGKYDIKDVISSALISGLLQGGASRLSNNYLADTQTGYQNVLADTLAGKDGGNYGLQDNIFKSAQSQANIFKAQRALQDQEDYKKAQQSGLAAIVASKGDNLRAVDPLVDTYNQRLAGIYGQQVQPTVVATAPVIAPSVTDIAPVVAPGATPVTTETVSAPIATIAPVASGVGSFAEYDAAHALEKNSTENYKDWAALQETQRKAQADIAKVDTDALNEQSAANKSIEQFPLFQAARKGQTGLQTMINLRNDTSKAGDKAFLSAFAGTSIDAVGAVGMDAQKIAASGVPDAEGLINIIQGIATGETQLTPEIKDQFIKAAHQNVLSGSATANASAENVLAPYKEAGKKVYFKPLEVKPLESYYADLVSKNLPKDATPEQKQAAVVAALTPKQAQSGDSIFSLKPVLGQIPEQSLSNNGAVAGAENTLGNAALGFRDLPGNVAGFVGDTYDNLMQTVSGDTLVRDAQGNTVWGPSLIPGLDLPLRQEASRLEAGEKLAHGIGHGAATTAGFVGTGFNPVGGSTAGYIFDDTVRAALGEEPLNPRQAVGQIAYEAGGLVGGKGGAKASEAGVNAVTDARSIFTKAGQERATATVLDRLSSDGKLVVPEADAVGKITTQTLAERTGDKGYADAQAAASRTGGAGPMFTKVEAEQAKARSDYFDKNVSPTTINEVSDVTAGRLVSDQLMRDKGLEHEQASVGYTPELLNKQVPIGPAKTAAAVALKKAGIDPAKLDKKTYDQGFKDLYETVTDPSRHFDTLGEIMDLRKQAGDVAADLFDSGQGRLGTAAMAIKEGLTKAIEKAPEHAKTDITKAEAKQWKAANDMYAEYMQKWEDGLGGKLTAQRKGEFKLNRSDIYKEIMKSPENIERALKIMPINAIDALREYQIAEFKTLGDAAQQKFLNTNRAELSALYRDSPKQLQAMRDVAASKKTSNATKDLGDAESKRQSVTAQETARKGVLDKTIADVLGIESEVTPVTTLKKNVGRVAGGILGGIGGSIFGGAGALGGAAIGAGLADVARGIKPAIVYPGMNAIKQNVFSALADANVAAKYQNMPRAAAPANLAGTGTALGVAAGLNQPDVVAAPAQNPLIATIMQALKQGAVPAAASAAPIMNSAQAPDSQPLNVSEFQPLEQNVSMNMTDSPDMILDNIPSSAVPAALVEAVIHQESRGNPKAVSNKGATGLMQIMPDTAKDIAKALGVTNYDLKDPKTNRLFGEFYLRQMLDQFGNAQLALAAYNAGPGRVSGWIKKYGNDWGIISRKLAENGTFQETRDYVPAILNSLGEVNAKKLRIDV